MTGLMKARERFGSRRGQSAIEYLSTYGWAILAIVVIAMILWYLGILDPDAFIGSPRKATGFGTFAVLDQKWSGTTATFLLGNALGHDVRVTGLRIGTTLGGNPNKRINAGESAVVTANGVVGCGPSGASYREVDFFIRYDNLRTGMTQIVDSGKISGRCV